MNAGDIIKFSKPVNADEESAEFILVEGPNVMGRVKIKLICDLPIPPIELIDVSEVELA